MSELIKINWIAVVSGLLWITGISLALAGFCRMEFLFLRHKKAVAPGDSRKNFFSKRLFFICVVLIVGGGLLNLFKMPSDNLLVTKLVDLDEAKCMNIKMEEKLAFLHKDLKLDPLNRKHSRNRNDVRDNTAALFYDGYIKAPFIKFEAGYYVINFDARGSEAWEEFSILKVEFETLNPNLYLITKHTTYVQLTRKMKPWSMGCKVEAPTIGRVKISFVNDDLEPGGKRDRNVWVKDIKIRKRGEGASST